ncbi:D-alanyl-D-alanine carboxypeptidase [Solihabitans fulvus]|uniref:D-alanyl-D-alanine carboxypeptidase n=2 Tax=Solihabitans fulvus TaxID=1892852 RepID=A0A5B2XP71_9PSEU|nr:D-alanyl-D-alanine carboxypeptidase [Solihabitans fulvus]
MAAPVGPGGFHAQDNAACPNRDAPPAAVDTSENPPAGAKPPVPLEVPATPIGGPRLGECGLVLPPNAQQPPDNITAQSWLLADLDTGAVLAANDPHGRQRPASVIKVLLAMVVNRELKQDTVVTATQDDAAQECNCTKIVPGTGYTVAQLTQALLLSSRNDVANALARALGGAPRAMQKMNALAREIGAQDTRAATPSGLDAPGMNTTSAYDVAVIFRAAMKSPDFATAIGLQRADLAGVGRGTIQVQNDNKAWLTSFQGAIGGKTGFTDDARYTFVGSAQRDGHKLAVVLLRAEQTPVKITEQAGRLLDYGFAMKTTSDIGKLVDPAAATPPKTEDVRPAHAAETLPQSNHSNAAPDQMTVAFGNAGGPLTVAAGLFLVVALLMVLRKRRARAARAARAAQSGP